MIEPPKILQWLLEQCCPASRPDLKGDFLELYIARTELLGRSRANRRLIRDVMSVIPLNFIIEEERKNYKPAPMFSTNLKIARRNLVKNKMYTIINISGLAVSLAVCILISLFIRDEVAYDKHFAEGEKVYRVAGSYSQGGAGRTLGAQTTYLVKYLIEGDMEALEAITRADFFTDIITIDGDKQFNENITFADSTFFDVFKIPFLKGDVNTALDGPGSAVIDRETAIRYFGTDDVLGKTIDLRNQDFAITGVFEPLPTQTHFQTSVIIPISAGKQWYPDWVLNNASGTSLYTYIRAKDNFDAAGFETLMTKLLKERWNWDNASAPQYFLQPLRSIHLESNLNAEVGVNGSKTTVYIFSITAIVIFILACINYINLTTAASFQRGKEVGMKKVLGSTTRMQVSQFQLESFLTAATGLIIAVVMAYIAMPTFNELSGKNLHFNPFSDPLIGGGLIAVLLLVGIVAGASPAFVLLRTSTMGMLTDKLQLSGQRSFIRSGLIVFQFAISITLIASTLIVIDQIMFIRKSDLGIDPESVVLIPFQTQEIAERYESLKTELMRDPSVVNVSASSGSVTNRVGGWRGYKTDPSKEEQTSVPSIAVSVDFFETLKAEMVDGRTFSKEYSTDATVGYVLNESAVKFLNIENPVGSTLHGVTFTGSVWHRREGVIVGVVKDFHFASLHAKVQPIVFYLGSELTESLNWMEVRISTDNMTHSIDVLKTAWQKIAGDRPFEYEFMDDAIAEHYQAEERFLKIFTTFSTLSIILGGLGLFGLTAFMAKRRTKEIGIRRVMGASTGTLVKILSKDFLKLVLIANVIGWPLAWYMMNSWLTNFAYQTTISIWLFVLTGAAVLGIAFLCILHHALKVSRVNPVNSLRTE